MSEGGPVCSNSASHARARALGRAPATAPQVPVQSGRALAQMCARPRRRRERRESTGAKEGQSHFSLSFVRDDLGADEDLGGLGSFVRLRTSACTVVWVFLMLTYSSELLCICPASWCCVGECLSYSVSVVLHSPNPLFTDTQTVCRQTNTLSAFSANLLFTV